MCYYPGGDDIIVKPVTEHVFINVFYPPNCLFLLLYSGKLGL